MTEIEYIKKHKRSDEYYTLLFWHGPLSQWWYSPFTIDGVEYNCTEQFMMATKASMFRDAVAEANIMIE